MLPEKPYSRSATAARTPPWPLPTIATLKLFSANPNAPAALETQHYALRQRCPNAGAHARRAQRSAGPFVAGEESVIRPPRLVEDVGRSIAAAEQGPRLSLP